MNIQIEITPSPALQTLFRGLAGFPQRALTAVGKGLNAAGPLIVGNAVKDRFTRARGPFPISQHKLGWKTGRLRETITNSKPRINSSTGEVTMGFGSNVKYFAFHEFGFSGEVRVKAHTRKNGQSVRGHSRKLVYPGRQPMQTELREQRTTDLVLDSVRKAVIRELNALEKGGPA